MAISNLESAVMAPKTQTVTQIKQPELQRPIMEQHLMRDEFSKTIERHNTQTVKTSKSDSKEYRYDAKEKGNNSYKDSNKKRQSNKREDESKKNKYSSRPGSIDIKI